MTTEIRLTPKPADFRTQPGQFQTIAEVKEYLSGDRIQCLLCGKSFRRLHSRHLLLHGMNADDYRERFGIPWNTSLTSKPSREKSSAAMTPERIAAFMKFPRQGAPVGRTHRTHAPAVRAEWNKNAVAGRVLAFQSAMAPCADCGTPVKTTALCATQPIHCELCATPEQLKSRRYAAKLKQAA